MRASILILQVLAYITSVGANVEKVVFLGPEPTYNCYYRLRVDASHRDVLTPVSSSVRRGIAAAFPSPHNSWKGSELWIILDDLEPLRRYEVRLCWSATQPTAFTLSVHHPDEVFNSSELKSSLFVNQLPQDIQHSSLNTTEDIENPNSQCFKSSGLFLHLVAAADYFTIHESLMIDVPPVKVEIILDPFILNVLPRSLLPTALYLAVLALFSYILSQSIWRGIRDLAISSNGAPQLKSTKNE